MAHGGMEPKGHEQPQIGILVPDGGLQQRIGFFIGQNALAAFPLVYLKTSGGKRQAPDPFPGYGSVEHMDKGRPFPTRGLKIDEGESRRGRRAYRAHASEYPLARA